MRQLAAKPAPCAVPVLAVILAYMAKGGSMAFRGILLFSCGVGMYFIMD